MCNIWMDPGVPAVKNYPISQHPITFPGSINHRQQFIEYTRQDSATFAYMYTCHMILLL